MRLLAAIWLLAFCITSTAQQVNLTNLNHALRWLDESQFPPFVKDSAISNEICANVVAALAKKFNAEPGTRPAGIDYKSITMFGSPKFAAPAKSSNPKDYQASVLSFITRGTSNTLSYWEMKVEVRQNGKTIYEHNTRHELVNFEGRVKWVDEASFKQHFGVLIDELLELSPPLASKYVLGHGIDYAELLRSNAQVWKVEKNSNLTGFGLPSFGPYTTLTAGKLDSPVLRTRKVLGTESSIGITSGAHALSFDQFKSIDFTKRKYGYLALAVGNDTLQTLYSINTHSVGTRRTFLSDLLSKDDDDENSGTAPLDRNIKGMFRTDTLVWEFILTSNEPSGAINGGYLENGKERFSLVQKYHSMNHSEMICKAEDGEYLASLDGSEMRIKKDLDPFTVHAFAIFYAVLMSTKNIK